MYDANTPDETWEWVNLREVSIDLYVCISGDFDTFTFEWVDLGLFLHCKTACIEKK